MKNWIWHCASDSNKDSTPHGLKGSKVPYEYYKGHGYIASGYSVRLFKD